MKLKWFNATSNAKLLIDLINDQKNHEKSSTYEKEIVKSNDFDQSLRCTIKQQQIPKDVINTQRSLR